ncbi:MAG: beta-mannosidase [Planctomycetota bacterium]
MQTIDLTGAWQWSHRGISAGARSSVPEADVTAPKLPASFPALVPGQVQLDLLRAGLIADPYAGTNELAQRWIGLSDWAIRREFTVPLTLLGQPAVELVCEGLDTVATVTVNGKTVGAADNMFRCWRFDLKSLLKPGVNTLEILFRSPVAAAARRAAQSPYPIPHQVFMHGEPNANFLRKSGTHFGWDWGPCLLPCGIWRPIRIEAYSVARLAAVTSWQVHHEKGAVDLHVHAFIHAAKAGEAYLTFGCCDAGEAQKVELHAGENRIGAVLRIARPALWWPAGYGAQNLCDLTVSLESGDSVQEKIQKIGFRRLELVREPDAAPTAGSKAPGADGKAPSADNQPPGESFFFRVNGVPIYIKGANWIPADVFDARVDRARLRNLLESARDAHLNLVRAWGGGIYEQDAFFDLCDELGLLVWQDFMFACMMYPADAEFLAGVRNEARQQIRRLMHHPSLATWCGNNENEDAIKWFPESTANRDRYVVDYNRLTIDTLHAAVQQEDPTRPFWPSSPSNGVHAWGNAQDPTRGDVHYWDVWHRGKPFSEYLTVNPRFSSEFGFQSFPSLETLAPVLPESERNPTAPGMEFRQRSPRVGNKAIIEHIAQQFRLPEGFANFIYVSQVLQALSIKTACEHWRRIKPYCMGAVYWQLNDIWQGPSWSSLEYDGRWKMLQYFAAKFFAPFLVSAFEKDGKLELWATSDRPQKLSGHVAAELWSWDGKRLAEKRIAFSLKPLDSKRLHALPIDSWLVSAKTKREAAFVTLTAEAGGERSENLHFLSPFKRVTLAQPTISVQVKAINLREFDLTLQSDAVAPFVFLSAPKTRGRFSQNGLLLLPRQKTTLRYFAWEDADPKRFEKDLTVKSLRDSY